MRITTEKAEVGVTYTASGRVNQSQRSSAVLSEVVKSDVVKTSRDQLGWRTPTPYSVTVLNRTAVAVNARHTEKASYWYPDVTCRGTWYNSWGVPAGLPSLSSTAPNRLLASCSQQLKSQSINLAVTFAERQKTVDLLVRSASTLAQAWDLVRRKRFAEAASLLGVSSKFRKGTKDVSSAWLQLQYGWMPLVYDVFGAVDELTRVNRSKGTIIGIRSRQSTSKTFESLTDRYVDGAGGSPWGYPYITPTASGKTEVHYTHQEQVCLWYRLNSKFAADLSRLGLTNPALVAWELVPFSFVIDWLLPIGQVLSALDAEWGYDYLGGSYTSVVRWVEPYSFQLKGFYSGTLSGQNSGMSMRRSVVTRTQPGFFLKSPLSLSHLATVVALVRVLKRT